VRLLNCRANVSCTRGLLQLASKCGVFGELKIKIQRRDSSGAAGLLRSVVCRTRQSLRRYLHLIDNVILANHSSRFRFYRRLLLLRSHRSLESSHSVLHNDLDVVRVS